MWLEFVVVVYVLECMSLELYEFRIMMMMMIDGLVFNGFGVGSLDCLVLLLVLIFGIMEV